MKRLVAMAMATAIIGGGSGCAPYRPIVMKTGYFSEWSYEHDLKDCRRYADQISVGTNAAVGAGAGAGLGALVGILTGAFFGVDKGELAAFGATLGALHGGVAGAAQGAIDKREIIRKCMTEKGYVVLK